MGDSLVEWRIKIGSFAGGSQRAAVSKYDQRRVGNIRAAIIVFLLLVIGGIELNPGPNRYEFGHQPNGEIPQMPEHQRRLEIKRQRYQKIIGTEEHQARVEIRRQKYAEISRTQEHQARLEIRRQNYEGSSETHERQKQLLEIKRQRNQIIRAAECLQNRTSKLMEVYREREAT